MSSGVTGDISKLVQMRQRIGQLVNVAERVAPKVGPAFRDFVREGFSTKKDPYGGAWKSISEKTRKRGTESALVRSGRMREKIDYLPFGTRVKLILGVFYARFHISTGRRTLPKPRQLPDLWSKAIEIETDRQIKQLAEGR